MNSVNSKTSRTQTLFQYICEAHSFIDSLMLEFIAPHLITNYQVILSKDMYFDHLSDISIDHPEVTDWAEYTTQKLQRDFFAFLRQNGLMESAPGLTVSRFGLRPEVFGFFSYGLFEKGIFGKQYFDSKIWKRYFLTQRQIEKLLAQAQVKGWLTFQISGAISEIIPTYSTLEEWINSLE